MNIVLQVLEDAKEPLAKSAHLFDHSAAAFAALEKAIELATLQEYAVKLLRDYTEGDEPLAHATALLRTYDEVSKR